MPGGNVHRRAALAALAAALASVVAADARGQNPVAGKLAGKKVAILVADGYEQIELEGPRSVLTEAGAQTVVVSLNSAQVKAWNMTDWGEVIKVDAPLESAQAAQYDAVLLPGGVMNPDKLRMNPRAIQFVKEFFEAGKPVAVICHGPWTLVEADVVRGRTLTSWPSLKTDIQNAGGRWENKEVVSDGGLVSSRMPADIPAFNREMIAAFASGHQ
jgi:protease I